MNKLKPVLLLLCFALMGEVFGQQGYQIKNKLTGEPITDASLIFYLPAKAPVYVKPDSRGLLHLPDSLAAFVSVRVVASGYQTLILDQPAWLQLKGDLVLNESVTAFNEIVISASRFEEQSIEVPRQIRLINREQIAITQPQNAADLVQATGEVFVQKSQSGGGSPVLRGFEANKILLVVDGVRMNNAIYRGGHLQNILRIDPLMLDRAEVLFGPGSVMYGSDALGGVIHFTTRKPVLSADGQVSVQANAAASVATANSYSSGHADVNIGFKSWASLTGITYSRFGDVRQGKNRSADMGSLGLRDSAQSRGNGKDVAISQADNTLQAPAGYVQTDILQKFLVRQSRFINHGLNIQYSNTGNVPRYDRLTEKNTTTGLFNSAEWYYGPETRLLLAYQFSETRAHRLYDGLQVYAGYQLIRESRHNRGFGSNNLNHRNEAVNVYSLNADLTKQTGKHEWRYGTELTRNTVTSTAYREQIATGVESPISTRYPDGGSTMQSLAFYLNDAYEWNDDITVSGGVRYSYTQLDATFVNKTFFPFLGNALQQKYAALNGQLGVVWKATDHTKISASLATGFRAPNVDDVGKTFESAGGVQVIIPNPDLTPEYAYSGEVALAQQLLRDKIGLSVTGYYTLLDDAIAIRATRLNGADSVVFDAKMTRVVSNRNVNQAYLYGGTVALNADLTNTLAFTSTLTYTYGRMVTDSSPYPLDHIPPLLGRTGLSWKGKYVKVEGYSLYNGWKRLADYNLLGEDNQQYATAAGMPAWYTLNLRVWSTLNWKQQKVILQIGIENLLDRNYRTFASGISAAGRNIAITLRYQLL